MKKTVLCLTFLCAVVQLFAQYPTIPSEKQAEMDRLKASWKQAADEAFAKALPIIEQEAASANRPYTPWASRKGDMIQAEIPAFPGAEGGAMFTPGGRGGKVFVVTNLNDSGPGSFREACEAGGARIVVFNVAGIIHLKSPIYIRAPYITIAGQTAPGDGVCIADQSVQMDTHDVIIRHMRFRRGNTIVTDREDALGGNPIGNIMLDHVSASWGCDENLSVYRHMYMDPKSGRNLKLSTVNVTFQNCISSEGLDTYNHAFGSTIGGVNNTYVRNLWACNAGRNPSMSSSEINYINNVIYNWYHRVGDGAGHAYNLINNYFKPGPVTPKDEPIGHRVFKVDGRARGMHWAYIEGNIMEGNAKVTKNNWDGGVQDIRPTQVDSIRSPKPHPMAPVQIMSAKAAYRFVLENAGATLPKRDAVDERIVRQVKNNKIEYVEGGNYDALLADMKDLRITRRLKEDSYKLGIIYDIAQVGGFPEYKGEPYKDSDNDGMPDEWEIKYGLNPNDASDAVKDCNGDGYTNIEKYIHNIDPTKKVDWKNLKNNHDTLAEKRK